MNADPENRLVCAELERLWNERMNQLAQAEAELRKSRTKADSVRLKTDMESLLTFPEKLRQTWGGDTLRMVDKKRIVRCLIEDIALNMLGDEIHIGIRFKGGITESLSVPRPLSAHEKIKTVPEIVEYVRVASKKYNAWDIAEQLNNAGKKSSLGLPFTQLLVRDIQNHHKIPPLTKHLRSIGYLSAKEKAAQLGIGKSTLAMHRLNGKFTGAFIRASKNSDYMYEP